MTKKDPNIAWAIVAAFGTAITAMAIIAGLAQAGVWARRHQPHYLPILVYLLCVFGPYMAVLGTLAFCRSEK